MSTMGNVPSNIGLHAWGWSVEDSKHFFIENAFQVRPDISGINMGLDFCYDA